MNDGAAAALTTAQQRQLAASGSGLAKDVKQAMKSRRGVEKGRS